MRSSNLIKVLFGVGVSVCILLFATQMGSIHIQTSDVIATLFHKNDNSMYTTILWDIRIPRIILGFLVGGALSVSGMALQTLLRNPLAEPYTVGVSSGATLAVVISIVLPISFLHEHAVISNSFAMFGGIFALLIVLIFARMGQRSLSTESIILSGIILSAFLGAFITLLISLSENSQMQSILGWTMGSLNGATWEDVQYVWPWIFIGSVYILLRLKTIRAFSDGDSFAEHIGVSVKIEKTLLFVAIAIIAGAAVSVSGMIGFVGLIIPHLIRRTIRGHSIAAYTLSFLVGGSYLVVADLIARTILSPTELPIGVITAIFGAPIFTLILVRQRQGG
jgi:iron complex transport system permease protein